MELWKLIVSYYSDLSFYNLQFDSMALFYFVGAFAVGGIASVIAAYVAKRRTGSIVDPILGMHAHDEATAISPEEGGFHSPNKLMLLKAGSMLRRTVHAVLPPEETEGEEVKAPTKQAFINSLLQTRFYIPDERRSEAERRFSAKRNGAASLTFSIVVVLVLTVLVYLFLPVVLRMVDNFLTMTGGNI